MKLMGCKYITNVKMKIIAVLRFVFNWVIGALPSYTAVCRHCLTFSDSEFIVLTLSAWNCFIHW